jgi:foldase protein PrsA
MDKTMNRMFLGIVGWMALAGAATAQVDANRVVMTVNGEQVLGGEYYRRMEFLPNVGVVIGGDFMPAPPGFLTLQRLIEERLLLQLARERDCLPTDAEVRALIADRVAENPRYVESWVALGLTTEELEQRHRLELAEFKLVTQGITVTDLEVERHYNENKSRYTLPRTYRVRLIAVLEDGKPAVDAAIAAGRPFDQIARELSRDTSRFAGGDMGERPEGEFSEAVRKELDALQTGGITNWIQGEQAWVRMKLESVLPSQLLPLDAKLRRDIRRELMLARGRNRNDLNALMRDKRRRANIELRQPAFREDMQRLLEAFKR